MGIINATPDSFSDGGSFLNPQAALAHGLQMVSEGAEILDIGGESTRPGAQSVEADEEIRRVLPIIQALRWKSQVLLSIDTSKAAVARAALDAGASIINDIEAHRTDPELWKIVAAAGAGYVLMHMQGEPGTMQAEPHYEDVVAEVVAFLAERAELAIWAGVARERIWLDPGIGFGKHPTRHNLPLLAGLDQIVALGFPVLLGASRKRFIGMLDGDAAADGRLGGSIAAAIAGAAAGVAVVRVHDVRETVQALKVWDAIRSG
jgi:dihydropteroate synthase